MNCTATIPSLEELIFRKIAIQEVVNSSGTIISYRLRNRNVALVVIDGQSIQPEFFHKDFDSNLITFDLGSYEGAKATIIFDAI